MDRQCAGDETQDKVVSVSTMGRVTNLVKKNWKDVLIGLVYIFLPLIGGGIVSSLVLTSPYRDKTLKQPSWAPPSWLFGPVWSVLYLMMGIASLLVWIFGKNPLNKDTIIALGIYGIQLVLNWFWTPIFFAWGAFAAALIEISVLWTMILFCIVHFFGISKIGSLLMVPYLAWVTFATGLTYSMVCLNGCYISEIRNTTIT